MPAIAYAIHKLKQQDDFQASLDQLESNFPQFCNEILQVINADHFNLTSKVKNLQQAIELSGIEKISRLMILRVVYVVLDQYKISGVDMPSFWQDCLRHAVSARMIGELIGLDSGRCFVAGFMQDIGFLLLFFNAPDKGVLWKEFHKREPEARMQMEMNTFGQQHEEQLMLFMQKWKIYEDMQVALSSHHASNDERKDDFDSQLSDVLNCADWLSAVYTADDKSYVINRCRKILAEVFYMEPYRAEELLEAIPDEIELTAKAMGIEITEHIAFSQILYQANIRLNEDNVNFQELTLRLEQALDERDRLAAELNRDLNLAREIQQSLLPISYADNYPVNGINISAKILSGDFYDHFELYNGDIYFNLGDVSGKGVNAALLMAKASSLFRCLGKRIEEPGELLYEINNELCETSIHGMFVTMVAGRYSPQTGEIILVNAGNPPALLFSNNGICREFEATSPPLGVMPDTIYTEYRFNLDNGSLYIYSDGVTEGYVNEQSMLELGGLFKLIATMDRNLSATERLQHIVSKFTNNDYPLRDDVTLLLLEKPRKFAYEKD